MTLHYGFIGLGAMGFPMAQNLRQKASPDSFFYVFDVHAPFCEKFVKENSGCGNIKIVSSAREVAEAADVIVTIVPAASHVRSVYLDEKDGIIAAKANKERLMLECSTIDSKTAREVGEAIANASGGTYVDTPVSVSLYNRKRLDLL